MSISCVCISFSVMSNLMDCSLPGFFDPWNSPGKNTEVGTIPFSRQSSRVQTQVSCIAGKFFTI